MKKLNIILFFLLLNTALLSAQNNFFKTPNNSELTKKKELVGKVKKNKVYRLDEDAMRSYLQNAPMEFKNNGRTIPLQIPLPDGSVETFNMVESPVLSPEIAIQNPDIKTYTGYGTTNKKAVIRLSLTSAGFNAIILNVGNDAVYFESYSIERSNIYFNYFSKDVQALDGKKTGSCLQESDSEGGHEHDNLLDKKKINDNTSKTQGLNATNTSVGTQLRTFRLAIAATGEFTASNGGTAVSGLAAVVSYVNRINAVFRNELSVNLSLVSGTNLIYTDAANDPYAQTGNLGPQLSINHNNLNAVLGAANYDIGHLIGFESGSGQGLAAVRSVCDQNNKGRALSFVGTVSSYGLSFMDNLLLHEMGHQFGMSHSYNSTTNVCTTRREATSVEPGAGTTIMSYGYICGTDNYPEGPIAGTLLQYHSVNYEESIAFLSTISCQVSTPTTNTPPIVTVPIGYTIPKSTPFVLTGSATDANNDNLTYCWEGTNIGTIVPDATTLDDTTQPPFFRSYPASASPSRTYPSLASILDGTNQAKGDKLPSVSVVTTHRLTVRDNNANGGGVTNASVTVSVDGTIGPFLETTNLSGIHVSSSAKTITWSVNGTNVSTPTVNILLSTDGGYTFPMTLVSGTANDGSQVVTLPNISTKTARIKIEAVGNIFFDISNVNFTIEQPLVAIVNGTNATGGTSNGTATVAGFGGKTTFDYNLKKDFTSSPYNIDTTLKTFSTISIPPLPTGVVINAVTLNFVTVFAISPSWKSDLQASLTGAYTLAETQLSTSRQIGLINPNPSIILPNFPLSGGSISLRVRDDFKDNATTEATIASANINVNYTKNGYTYLWSNGATTPTISSLAPGVYSVTVTDASGATATGSYTVLQPSNYSIQASAGSNGTISPAGTSTVASGGSQIYTFTPVSCYEISDVKINGVSIGVVSTYTFNNVTNNNTINVTFESTETNATTTVTACDTYTWNGTIYRTSGSYTGTTTNCVTEKLNLTITPSSINTTSISACDSYTWNGTTYRTSGLYTGTTINCVTEKLALTIIPAPNAGISGTLSIPTGTTPTNTQLFAALTGADAGGTWSQDGLVYTYAVGATAPCTLASTATVTVSEVIPTLFTFCQGAKVSDAVGITSLKFYTALTRGTLLSGTTTLSNRTVYATQTLNGIESTPRVPVMITVNPLPPTVTTLTTSDTVLCKYIGTENTVTYTATSGSSSYIWTVPSGVSIKNGQGTNTLIVDFSTATTTGIASIGSIGVKAVNTNGCISSMSRNIALSTKFPVAPRTLVLTNSEILDGTPIKKVGSYLGTTTELILTAEAASTATSYRWLLPTGVNLVGGISTSNVITVNFSGVSGTGDLPISVYSVGGCGESLARTLTLTRALPKAPSALVLTTLDNATLTLPVDVSNQIKKVDPYVGTSTILTLAATPITIQGATALSYEWVLPAGVKSYGTTAITVGDVTTISSLSNIITVDFEGVGNNVLSLPISVYAINGAGKSTVRTLNLTSAAPATPGVITTPLLAIPAFNPDCASTIALQIPSVFGVTYNWTVGSGAMIISGQGTNSIVVDVTEVTNTTILASVIGSNGTGSSLVRTLTIRKAASCRIATNEVNADEFNVIAYPNPSSNEFTVKVTSSNGKSFDINVYDMKGRLIENLQENSNTIEVGANYPAGVYNVIVTQDTKTKTVRVIKK